MHNISNDNVENLRASLEKVKNDIDTQMRKLASEELSPDARTYFEDYSKLSEENKMAKWDSMYTSCTELAERLKQCKTPQEANELMTQYKLLDNIQDANQYICLNSYIQKQAKLQALASLKNQLSNIDIKKPQDIEKLTKLNDQIENSKNKIIKITSEVQNQYILNDNILNSVITIQGFLCDQQWQNDSTSNQESKFNNTTIIDTIEQFAKSCATQYDRTQLNQDLAVNKLIYEGDSEKELKLKPLGKALRNLAAMAQAQLQDSTYAEHSGTESPIEEVSAESISQPISPLNNTDNIAESRLDNASAPKHTTDRRILIDNSYKTNEQQQALLHNKHKINGQQHREGRKVAIDEQEIYNRRHHRRIVLVAHRQQASAQQTLENLQQRFAKYQNYAQEARLVHKAMPDVLINDRKKQALLQHQHNNNNQLFNAKSPKTQHCINSPQLTQNISPKNKRNIGRMM